MSRTKNTHKIKSQPTTSISEEIFQFRYGDKCDQAALDAIKALKKSVFPVISYPPCPPLDNWMLNQERDKFWKFVEENYRSSWLKHDGSFFRRLADAMEVHEISNDPVWSVGVSEILFRQNHKMKMFTVQELHDELNKRGEETSTNQKTVRRIFTFLRIKPSPAKPGPSKGSKQKSFKQGGESRR